MWQCILHVGVRLMGRAKGQSSDSDEFMNGKISNDEKSDEGDEEEDADTDSEEDDILKKCNHTSRTVLTQQTSLG